ncbi:MAG TPA: hypothetical protein VFE48_17005 [Methylomirabilota bacterium]|nr:hypothetical protein [Methylomirabilota bacterium]
MRRPWFGPGLAAAWLAVAALVAPAGAQDRLERFRALAREQLAAAADTAERERLVGQLYELVDAEVLDSLHGGGPFAAPAFIRERLDAMMEAWGGVTLRVVRAAVPSGREPLTVGLYTLSGPDGSGALRFYSGAGPEATLSGASVHAGQLEAQVWPAGADRVVRVLALWAGAPEAQGARPLRGELWAAHEGGRVERAWTSAAEWPDGFWVSDWRTQPGELVVRYQPRYPGWKPGCPGQTEQEDHYRLTAAGGLAVARRQVTAAWHRELGAAADRLFGALAARDPAGLARLVPAPALRARLPATLVAEPVCETPPAGPRAPVTMAATEVRDDGRRVPWALTWTRQPAGWRLSAARPVLQ